MRKAAWACAIVGTCLCLSPRAVVPAISDADRGEARKTIEQTFGAQIRRVRLTPDKADDVETAAVLLKASEDAATPPAVRAELANTAMELAASTGTPGGIAMAEQALARWSVLTEMNPIERGQQLVDLRQAYLARAAPDQRPPAARRLIEVLMELATAYENAGDLDNAAGYTLRALGEARTSQLADLVDELTAANMRIQRLRSFKRDLAEAEKELAAAQAGNNPPLVKKTFEKIGLLYILRNGDAIGAAEALAKAEHEWAAPADALRRRAAGARLKVEESFPAAEMLFAAANRAEPAAKAPLLELLLDVCAELAPNVQTGSDQGVRVEFLRKQARDMLARLPNSSLQTALRDLRKLLGRLTINPDGTIQLSYAFASNKELADWSIVHGQWACGRGGLAVAPGGGAIYHNVRFRADRPMQVSFSASGPGSITAVLAPDDQLAQRAGVYAVVGQNSGAGWFLGGLGGKSISGNLSPNTQPYRVQIIHDGLGNFTYVVNGQALGKSQVQRPLVGSQFRLGFEISRGRTGAFSNVTIQGTPVGKDPVAPATASPPPPRPGQTPPTEPPQRPTRRPRPPRPGS